MKKRDIPVLRSSVRKSVARKVLGREERKAASSPHHYANFGYRLVLLGGDGGRESKPVCCAGGRRAH